MHDEDQAKKPLDEARQKARIEVEDRIAARETFIKQQVESRTGRPQTSETLLTLIQEAIETLEYMYFELIVIYILTLLDYHTSIRYPFHQRLAPHNAFSILLVVVCWSVCWSVCLFVCL